MWIVKYHNVLVSGYHQACVGLYKYALNANASFAKCQGWATSNTSRSQRKAGIRNLLDSTVSTFCKLHWTISVFDLRHQTNLSSMAAHGASNTQKSSPAQSYTAVLQADTSLLSGRLRSWFTMAGLRKKSTSVAIQIRGSDLISASAAHMCGEGITEPGPSCWVTLQIHPFLFVQPSGINPNPQWHHIRKERRKVWLYYPSLWKFSCGGIKLRKGCLLFIRHSIRQ